MMAEKTLRADSERGWMRWVLGTIAALRHTLLGIRLA